MCLMVLLAADQPLPLVEWDETRRGFNVSELTEAEAPARERLDRAFVYHAGSQTHCGCGFNEGLDENNDPEDERDLARQARLAFAQYMRDALGRIDAVDVYTVWWGEWTHPVESRRVVGADEFERPGFLFVEKELLTVRNDARANA